MIFRFSAENSNSIYNNKQQRVLEQRQEQQYLAGVAEGVSRHFIDGFFK
jgi:hypothetical protein